jgi:hypothetical protein
MYNLIQYNIRLQLEPFICFVDKYKGHFNNLKGKFWDNGIYYSREKNSLHSRLNYEINLVQIHECRPRWHS